MSHPYPFTFYYPMWFHHINHPKYLDSHGFLFPLCPSLFLIFLSRDLSPQPYSEHCPHLKWVRRLKLRYLSCQLQHHFFSDTFPPFPILLFFDLLGRSVSWHPTLSSSSGLTLGIPSFSPHSVHFKCPLANSLRSFASLTLYIIP